MRGDLLIVRVGFAPAGVADDRFDDPFRFIVGRLYAPKASASENSGLCGRRWCRIGGFGDVHARERRESGNRNGELFHV